MAGGARCMNGQARSLADDLEVERSFFGRTAGLMFGARWIRATACGSTRATGFT